MVKAGREDKGGTTFIVLRTPMRNPVEVQQRDCSCELLEFVFAWPTLPDSQSFQRGHNLCHEALVKAIWSCYDEGLMQSQNVVESNVITGGLLNMA